MSSFTHTLTDFLRRDRMFSGFFNFVSEWRRQKNQRLGGLRAIARLQALTARVCDRGADIEEATTFWSTQPKLVGAHRLGHLFDINAKARYIPTPYDIWLLRTDRCAADQNSPSSERPESRGSLMENVF